MNWTNKTAAVHAQYSSLTGGRSFLHSAAFLCFQKLPRLASRAFSSSARQLKNKVPESQKIFQVRTIVTRPAGLRCFTRVTRAHVCFLHLQEDNGLPVHIKGGTGDVLLYRATMTLTIAGEERCSRCISVVQEDKARISDRNKACVETQLRPLWMFRL